MGRLDARLYCCSAQMIDDVAAGELALAYNVLGSYASDRLARDHRTGWRSSGLEDFANVMLRTALIPAAASEIEGARALLDALLREGMGDGPQTNALPPLTRDESAERLSFGPIRLGPALMVYLDPLNRRAFLEAWENALEQR